MFNLSDQAVRGGCLCLSKAGLLIGGTASKARTSAPNGAGVDFVIDGKLYHLADADNNITLPTETLTEDYTNIFLVSVNLGNTIEVVSGTAVLTAALDDGSGTLAWPTPTNGYCPIGAILIDAGDSGDFLVNSDNLSGGSETVEYIDLFALPAEPITASAT